jgi:phospholipid/cholesterol/gamma-HCH transport system substrate-binding protein
MKRRDEVLVGVLMTVAVLILVTGTIWLSRGGLQQGYPLYARFSWGAGLKQGQQVILGGPPIGYVDEVELEMEAGTIVVTLRINDKYKVPEGTIAYVEPYGIFGDQIIALKPPRPNPSAYQPGDTIPTGKPPATTAEILARVDSIGTTLGDVAEAFEIQLVQQGGLEDLRRSLAGMNRLVLQLNEIATEQSRQITMTMQGLRSTLAAFDSAGIDSTVRNLRTTSANLAVLTGDLQQTSDQIQSVLGKLETGNGSAALFLNDSTVYANLSRSTARLDSLIADIKANPRKYINLSIFGGR